MAMNHSPETPQPGAKRKVMDLLSRRDHSELELRTKLSAHYSDEEIEEAIEHARTQKWLTKEEDLVAKITEELNRKERGILVINQKLEEKGLPPVKADPDHELEKARHLAKTKWSRLEKPEESDRDSIARFLTSRGFEESIVRKVVYEEL